MRLGSGVLLFLSSAYRWIVCGKECLRRKNCIVPNVNVGETMSQLINGNIPASTICPFSSENCFDSCPCNGRKHTCDFSCALARGLDMCSDEENLADDIRKDDEYLFI